MRLGGSPPTTVMPHPLRWLVMGGDYEEGSTPANNNSSDLLCTVERFWLWQGGYREEYSPHIDSITFFPKVYFINSHFVNIDQMGI